MFSIADNSGVLEILRADCFEGLEKRKQQRQIADDLLDLYQKRINHELSVISDGGLVEHFYIAASAVQWAKDNQCLNQPIWGNGAGSLVCYCLGISDVDPCYHCFLFERFISPPNIDESLFTLAIEADQEQQMVKYVQSLPGIVRNITPVYEPNRVSIGKVTITFADSIGYAEIQEIRQAVETNLGIAVDLNSIPLDDTKTLQMIASGDGQNIYQLDDEFSIEFLSQFETIKFEDLVACIVLCRDQAREDRIDKEFIARKQGEHKIQYDISALKPILEETYGMLLYQEQLMQVLSDVVGIPNSEINSLRKLITHPDYRHEADANLVTAALHNGLTPAQASAIVDLLNTYGKYVISKAFITNYFAWFTYQSAYLKAHYGEVFRKYNELG